MFINDDGYVFLVFFYRCKDWLRRNSPQFFPDLFPEECAARLEALRIAEETGAVVDAAESNMEDDQAVKVAIPIEQKTSGGKKKKAPAEIVLALGQRKGKKQVTIVYGLDLFGIKLKEAAKAAKRKFATGSSLTTVSCFISSCRSYVLPCILFHVLILIHYFRSQQIIARLLRFRVHARKISPPLCIKNGA